MIYDLLAHPFLYIGKWLTYTRREGEAYTREVEGGGLKSESICTKVTPSQDFECYFFCRFKRRNIILVDKKPVQSRKNLFWRYIVRTLNRFWSVGIQLMSYIPAGQNLFKVSKITLEQRSLTLNRFLPLGYICYQRLSSKCQQKYDDFNCYLG